MNTGEAPTAQPLSSAEAVLWTIERDPTLRSTIVVLALLAGSPDLPGLRERLDSATRLFPRLRPRVQPRRAGLPRWVDVGHLDLDYHLRCVHLPGPGTLDDVLELAGQQAGDAFDPARPLWLMTVVEGLEGDRAAVVLKVHHAMTDGVGGVGLLPILTDPEPSPAANRPSGPSGGPGPARARSAGPPGLRLLGAVGSTLGAAVARPLSTAGSAPRVVRSIGKLLAPATRALSPVTRARGLDRHLDTLDVAVEDLARAGRSVGGTLNDAFLAAVVGGLRRYHQHHGFEVGALRVTMPISTRRQGDTPGGNRFTPARFALPTAIDDPAERMRALGNIARSWRQEPAIGLTNVLAGVLSHLPGEVTTSIFGSMLKGVDFVATNVPGGQERSWLAGLEVLQIYGFGPTSGAAVSVALLSHLDTCWVGVNSDTSAILDPDVLTACLNESFEEVVAVGRHSGVPAVVPVSRVPAAEPVSGRRRLSALDTSFLALESPTTPMHVGALILLEGGALTDAAGRVRIGAIRNAISDRLVRCPRMRQRIASVPFGAGRPVWIDDQVFDISDHVLSVDVPTPGSREQLEDLCCELQMRVLDRTRPLWEMWFVGGLADGSVGLVYKVHHAVVDGVSAAETFELLLDPTPLPDPCRVAAPPTSRRDATSSRLLLRDSLVDGLRTTVRVGATGIEGLLHPRPVLAAGLGLAQLFGRTTLAPRTSLNGHVGAGRRLATVNIDLAAIKRTGRPQGATVNDVVLTLVASGLSELLASRGESTASVRVLVPVSLRHPDDRGSLGNQVTALVARLPVSDQGPTSRLAHVVAETTRLKAGSDAAGLDLVLRWADTWPMPMLSSGAGLVHHQPFVNLVVTNVRGPEHPLELLGAELTEIVPIVPLGGNLTLGVAVFSYRGRLAIGLHADADAMGDLEVLAAASSTPSSASHLSNPLHTGRRFLWCNDGVRRASVSPPRTLERTGP
jgi:WS/DGAT/MGAT family acyltransferase